MLVSFRQSAHNPSNHNTIAPKPTSSVHFAGINANFSTNVTQDMYVKAYEHPEDHLLGQSATSILREFYPCMAATQLLKDGKPTAIHVLGCSDGSEAYSYAMFANQQLTKKQLKNPDHIQVTGIDMAPDLIELAKTGYLVCSDIEKARQTQPGNPVGIGKWGVFFEKKDAPPENFEALIADSPRLAQITRDPVAKIKIGDGMHWYKVKQKNLPSMQFETDTIENYIKRPASSHQRQIYVLANSWAYMMAIDASNPAAIKIDPSNRANAAKFVSVLQELKKSNSGKEVVIVVGDLERNILQRVDAVKNVLPFLGMVPMSAQELQTAGIKAQDIPNVEGRIWRLKTDS